MDKVAAHARIRDEIEGLAPVLIDLSHSIHADPELGFEEHVAHDLLTSAIEQQGIAVTRGAYGLDTAFEARVGSGGPVIAVCCEYDALPGLGHACGHNVIAAAGLGAGLAASRLADELGGTVVILGTPAEEGGGGKEYLIRRGAFEDVDAAMMVHPADRELRTMHIIAVHSLEVEYHGRASHAAASPHGGLNALDAAVLGYNNIAALRQHIRPDERIHGIFSNGGDKANVVPEYVAAQWHVRSATVDTLQPLRERVEACLKAGATAAGCEIEIRWNDVVFADMRDNSALLDLYADNARVLGRDPQHETESNKLIASTDMGNVSHIVPSIHPMIQLAPDGVSIHTPEFARHAVAATGDQAALDGAAALAMTITDCWLDPDAMKAIRDEFTTLT